MKGDSTAVLRTWNKGVCLKTNVYRPKVLGNQVRAIRVATKARISRLFVTLLGAALLFTPVNSVLATSFPVQYQQKAWFYKPASDATTTTLKSYFDNFILTNGDEQYRDSLEAKGVDSPFLQYVRFDAIQDPGSCSARPDKNQVANQRGDFCDIKTNHPSWFLLDRNGKKMYNGDMVMMDPGNDGWRSFFLTRIRGTQQLGWHGVFLDNVEGSLGKRSQYNQMPAKYSNDAAYQAAIKGMLQYLYEGYFRPHGRPMFANLISLRPASVWSSYLNYLDGMMCEAWSTGWGNSDWRTTTEWLEHLDRAESAQQRSKWIIGVAQGYKTDYDRQRFAYMSFLLVDNGRMFFRYGQAAHYDHAFTYSNYQTNYGVPLGDRYRSGSWYCRDYSKGKACVNPSTHGAYFDLN